MKSRLLVVLACLGLVAALPTAAGAATVQTFSTSQSEFDPGVRNQGWWSGHANVANDDANDNYSVAQDDTASESNFFTFDLSGLPASCRVQSATLQLTRFEGSGTGVLTYGLWDVSTPAAVLNANDGVNAAIATDLSSGTSFGSFQIDSAESLPRGDVLSLPLNSLGLAAVSSARGGFFSIGGALAPSNNGFLFGFSDGVGTQQLVVTCAPATPTSTFECKNGGWRSFPGFKNQGDCVSYVTTNGKNQPTG